MSTKVTVFSGQVSAQEISQELQAVGIVVVVDSEHVDAGRLEAEVREQLADDGKRQAMNRLTDEVPDEGWIDYFVYEGRHQLGRPVTLELVRRAVRRWKGAGRPAYHLATLI
jgi:hypothetical protein